MLGGASIFSLSFADVFAKMFDITSADFEKWTIDNSGLIGDYFDGINGNAANFMSTFGGIFEEIGTKLTDWWDIISDAVGAIIDIVKGIVRSLQGILDFITGIFTGDMEKAAKGFFEFVQGICQAIWGAIKGIINIIIDALNTVWSAIYGVLKSIVDGVGDFVGMIGDWFGKDWGFSMPDEVPRIPRLAKGGLVTAPTLAIVGDNKNAKNDPEVVSPLSKLQGMIDNGSSEDTEILRQILMYLKMLYEFYENGGGDVSILAELDGDVVFKDMIKRDKAYNRRHGKGAFAR